MSNASKPENEVARLAALHRYRILDTPAEAAFDRITALAARLFDVPLALVSLVDESRAWFKSCYGFDAREMPRDDTICSFAVLFEDVFVVPDTKQDSRFVYNPFVRGEPGIRFYAGAPLLTPDGFNLGTLCLLDSKPRDELSDEQKATLTDLAAMVVDELELRLAARQIAQIDEALLEVTRSVSAATGETFFSALVQHFTKVLAVDYAYMGLLVNREREAIKTIAVCTRGQIVDNFEYLLQDTPCQEVLRQRKICCYPRGVQTLFPNAPLLEPLSVESYVAIPFFDSTGAPLGLLGVMDSKPLENIQLAESLLTIFALRIGTELERQRTEAARQRAHRDLESLVERRTVELSKTNELLQLEIRERQQAELALQKEQEMLKALLDNVQAGIVACNAEGILTLFNRAAREFHGLPEQPLPPEQWAEHYDLYMPDGKTRIPKEEIPLFKALQGQTVGNVEMTIAPKQGTTRTILASGQLLVDEWGNKQGAVVVMHDITERKKAEAERVQLIREQTARQKAEAERQQAAFLAEISTMLASSLNYEDTLARVANLVVMFFADWCAIDLLQPNQSITRVALAHCEPEKIKLGWELHLRYPKQIDGAEGIPKVLRTGQTEIVTEISDAALGTMARDAEHLQILRELGLKSCIVSPLIARGQILGAISFVTAESDRRYTKTDLALAENIAHRAAIAIDNTNLYKAERIARTEAEAANRIKDEFLAVLSHELRSPLNPILGWSQLLRSGRLDASNTAQALEAIERNARLQTQLIEDLLDVSRILQGKLALKVSSVNLVDTIEAALETVQLAAETKSIQIQTQFNLEVKLIKGDPSRIQQIVWNLLSNAIKFTPQGGLIEVKLSSVAGHSSLVEEGQITTDTNDKGLMTKDKFAQIQVRDTGKGINPEFLPYVFESFRQADATTTRKFGGLGLGLAIARHLVELHGGTIMAESLGEGQGATFTVRLPLAETRGEAKEANRAAPYSLLLTRIRILIVDDEPDTRDFLTFMLEQQGATVTAVASANEALNFLKQSKPDLLISDIGMPKVDGYTLLRRIRALAPEQGGQIPAIALTSYARDIDRQEAIAAGFQKHIAKPVQPDKLAALIAELFNSTNL
ncbi:GAF domain-containing protein [Pleurocapsales cyanobacterium LEGE 06147]|nr:GAF domain-containing protein [Pleurocapsales cyanobacterium LEGE 06147]